MALDSLVELGDGWPRPKRDMWSSTRDTFEHLLLGTNTLLDSESIRTPESGDVEESDEGDLATMIHWPETEELLPTGPARTIPSITEEHVQSGQSDLTSDLPLEQPLVPSSTTATLSGSEPDTHTATFTFHAPPPPPPSPKKIRLHPRRRRRHRSMDMSQPKNMIAAKWHEHVASSRDADDQNKE
ncbi:hypothetical protein BDZ85DRAFT_281529 [Elsinoe ampelina]|uniref:Uncharacterized protein n=1 Tax=Elsinoe ampelina TaxID=302913 RepID=A0A6A6GD30_9PEZI|nr:hypothetical protein BDZ85DRAFT_281529 [Elsinoe ampelina]